MTGPSLKLKSAMGLFLLTGGTLVFCQANSPAAQDSNVHKRFTDWVASYLEAKAQGKASHVSLAAGDDLALERRAVLKGLIESDPKRALAVAIPETTRNQLPQAVSRHLEVWVSGRGDYRVSVAEDSARRFCEVRREVSLGGQTYAAYVYGNRLRQVSQAGISLRGIAIDRSLALDERASMSSGSGATASGGANQFNTPWAGDVGGGSGYGLTSSPGPTRGTKTLLFMPVAFSDDPAPPISQSAARDLMNQVNQWYVEESYDLLAIIADVTPLLILPQTKAYYSAQGIPALQTAARAAALAAGFDTDNYDFEIVNNQILGPPNFYFAGFASVGGKGLILQVPSLSVTAHELGHNLGLWHANFWSAAGDSVIGPGSTSEYGNSFDIMGADTSTPWIHQFNAESKHQLSWLPFAFVHTVTTSGLYRLYAYDVPGLVDGRKYALQVKKDAVRSYWAEFRQLFTDNPWTQNGVLLNWNPWDNQVVNSLGGTVLLDTTPGTPSGSGGEDDAAVVMGRTFADPAAGVYLTPVAKGSDLSGDWIDLQVNLGTFTSNSPPTLQLVADQTTVATNVPVHFIATASDPNGDNLAYYWDFGDLAFGSNAPSATKSWSSEGEYVVRCMASDMKGGSCSRYVVVTVGSPGTFRAAGQVTTSGGQALEGVCVHNGLSGSSYAGTYTDSDGHYTLANLPAGGYTLGAVKYGYDLSPAGWSNPISLGPNTLGADWTAMPGPVVSTSAPDPSAAEPNPTADTGTFTITRSGSLASPLTVQFNLNGTAVYPTDYNLSPVLSGPPCQVTLPSGAAATNLVVVPLSDSKAEGSETAILTMIEDAAYMLGPLEEATITIADRQTPGRSLVNIYADEDLAPRSGSGSGWYHFTRDGAATNDLTIYYLVGGTATNGVDYAALPGTVTIPAGTNDVLLPLTAINNDAPVGMKTAVLTLASNATYVVGSSSNATVNIVDDYSTTVIVNASGSPAWAGAAQAGTFTITRVGSLAANLVVDYSLSGTVTNGVDYNFLPGSVLIPAGQNTAAITVTPISNDLPRGKRTVTATLLSSPGYNVGNPGLASIAVLDDQAPAVSVLASRPNASEAGPVSGEFTFTRTGSTTDPLTVWFDIYGSAYNGADYVGISNSIVIPAGATSAALTITPIQDTDSRER